MGGRLRLTAFAKNTFPKYDINLHITYFFKSANLKSKLIQNLGLVETQNTIIGNSSFENVEEFKYLGVTVTNAKYIREEMKRRINMGHACYCSLVKNFIVPFAFQEIES